MKVVSRARSAALLRAPAVIVLAVGSIIPLR